jgi:hypothetical protein
MSSIFETLRDAKKVKKLGDKDSKFWSYPKYNSDETNTIKRSSFDYDIDFPDPKEYIIGFFIA